ncbi:MAG TPA: 50S ribosomal protein L29 [Amoebophilaceae bacterium]|nr:50S ribosomal protein L29 [Amoebophilaceae bacterium]
MKYKEIKSLALEERNAKLAAEEENLKKLRFAHAISPIENPMRIKYSRKLIAKLKTAGNATETPKN